MTIPLDNLYHYIEGLFPEPVCMYLFYPHGSRDILDVVASCREWTVATKSTLPQAICVDQEPLNYELYKTFTQQQIDFYQALYNNTNHDENLRFAVPPNVHDNPILLHSEKNSKDLELYKNDGFVDVYYWCHAIIARDWYRFAEHDPRLCMTSTPLKDFLIYCRDWSGSREYRIKFQELLHKNNLVDCSITGIMKTNGCGTTIENFDFKNQSFVPDSTEFFYQLHNNSNNATVSANYCPDDFVNTHLSVVLETIFDGTKIHLTEKILRPIACGHPFILASGPGSLSYLRSYGFKTFSPWIDESYDQETNSVLRLEKIIQSMKTFSQLANSEKQHVLARINSIAEYNKQWFFSDKFINQVTDELKENIKQAMCVVKQTRSLRFRNRAVKHVNPHRHPLQRSMVANYLNQLRKINPPGE